MSLVLTFRTREALRLQKHARVRTEAHHTDGLDRRIGRVKAPIPIALIGHPVSLRSTGRCSQGPLNDKSHADAWLVKQTRPGSRRGPPTAHPRTLRATPTRLADGLGSEECDPGCAHRSTTVEAACAP